MTPRNPHSKKRSTSARDGRLQGSGRARHAKGRHAAGPAQAGGAPAAHGPARPTVASREEREDLSKELGSFTIGSDRVTITRRQLVYGAAAAAAVAAGVGGYTYVSSQNQENDDTAVLEVPADAVTTADDFKQGKYKNYLQLEGNFKLPYGTLVWCNSNHVAACLLPGDSANPLTQIALLWLATGSYPVVREQAVGQDEGYNIFDVRCSTKGLIWTEADILDGSWRIYTATMDEDGTIGESVLVDEGGADYETPSIAIVGSYAFWQVLPNANGEKATADSVLKRSPLGESSAVVVISSPGRMATPPYAMDDQLVVTPRTEGSSVHYQLTLLDAETCAVKDSLVLPASMKPLDAGYGKTGFTFAFDAIYDYGDGISNLGTYTPLAQPSAGAYSGAKWFRWGRTPTSAPCWCKSLFMVKSSTAVCGVDFENQKYFSLKVDSGAADYGDVLASTGNRNCIVTYSNVNTNAINKSSKQYTHVRVWKPM